LAPEAAETHAGEPVEDRLGRLCRRYTVVEASRAHALALAPVMRRADREEVWAAAGLRPLAALERSLDASCLAWTWLVDGRPACMFGLATASLMSGIGEPWMLTSELILSHQTAFLRHYRPFLAEMRALFPVLTNWVDARYIASIKWLQWMGFEIHAAEPYGPFGMLFHRFDMRGKAAA
jgi:hypothetical protein